MQENPYLSNKFLINRLTQEDRLQLKKSLINKDVKILYLENYGFFTEHGFPVAFARYKKGTQINLSSEFYAKVLSIEPMVTIDEFGK